MELLLQLAVLGIARGAIYSFAALGFGLVLAQTKIFHLAHGGVYMMAGYAYYYCYSEAGLPMPVAVVATALVAVAGGVVVHLVAYQPLLRRRKITFLVGFVASLGMLTVITNVVVLVNGGGFVEVKPSFLSSSRLEVGGVYLQTGHVVGVVLAGAAFLGLEWFLSKTYTGTVMRAISADRGLARAYGVRAQSYDLMTIVLASLLLVPMAIILPSLSGLSSGTALLVGTFAFTATVIGGLGSTAGTFAAAILLGLIQSVSVYWLPGAWQEAVGLGALVIVLMVRPSGLFVKASQRSSLAAVTP